MDYPAVGDWYEVDPRQFGERFVQVAWCSGGEVCVNSPQVGYFKLWKEDFWGCTVRGPVNPDNGRLLCR